MKNYIKRRRRAAIYSKLGRIIKYVSNPFLNFIPKGFKIHNELSELLFYNSLERDLERSIKALSEEEEMEYKEIIHTFLTQKNISEPEYVEWAYYTISESRKLQKKINPGFIYQKCFGLTWIEWGILIFVLWIVNFIYSFFIL